RRVLRRRRRLPRDWRANDRLHTESSIPLRDSPRWRNLEARFEAFPRPSCRDGQMPDCDAKGYCRSVEERALIERIRVTIARSRVHFSFAAIDSASRTTREPSPWLPEG